MFHKIVFFYAGMVFAARAALVVYPEYPAAIQRDDAYSVSVAQGSERKQLVVYNHTEKSILLGRTRGGDVNRRFCEFAFDGAPVRVDIHVHQDVSCYKVFPARLRLKNEFKDGVISVWLDRPEYFGIQLNDYDKTILSVIADPPEDPALIPRRGAPGVLYVDKWLDAPERDGKLVTGKDIHHVYIAPGAVLNARLTIQGPGTLVNGRGMILDPMSDIFRFDQLKNKTLGFLIVAAPDVTVRDVKLVDARTFNYIFSAPNTVMRDVKAFASMMCSDGMSFWGGKNVLVDHAWLYVGDNALVIGGTQPLTIRNVAIGTSCAAIFPQSSFSIPPLVEKVDVFRADEGLINNYYNGSGPVEKRKGQTITLDFKNLSAIDSTYIPWFFQGANMGTLPKTLRFHNVSIPEPTGASLYTSIGKKGPVVLIKNLKTALYTDNYHLSVTNLFIGGKAVSGLPSNLVSCAKGTCEITCAMSAPDAALPLAPMRKAVSYVYPYKVYIGDSLQYPGQSPFEKRGKLYLPAELLPKAGIFGLPEKDGFVPAEAVEKFTRVTVDKAKGNIRIAYLPHEENLVKENCRIKSVWQRVPSYIPTLETVTEKDGTVVYHVERAAKKTGMQCILTDGFLRNGNGRYVFTFSAKTTLPKPLPVGIMMTSNEKSVWQGVTLTSQWKDDKVVFDTHFDLAVTDLMSLTIGAREDNANMQFKNLRLVRELCFKPTLLQSRLNAGSVRAGGKLNLTCWWENQGEKVALDEESLFVHIRRPGEAENAPNAVRFGADHRPSIPLYRWYPGRIVRDSFDIHVPDGTPSGDYVVLLGIYNQKTGARQSLDLPVLPGDNQARSLVTKFKVLPVNGKADETPVISHFAPMPPLDSIRPPKPAKVITLGEGPLTVEMDAALPCVTAWKWGNAELPGDPEGEPPVIKLLSVADNRGGLPADASPFATKWSLRQKTNRAVYRAEITEAGKTRVAFDLSFLVKGCRVEVTLDHVCEEDGYQLGRVQLNRLVAARDGARLALPYRGGRLIDPAKSSPAEVVRAMGWETQALSGVLYDKNLLCAVDLESIDDNLVATVGEKWASLGAFFKHRAQASGKVPSLLLSERSSFRLRFFKPEKGSPDWTDGAKLLRAEVNARPPAVYENAFIYKIFCDSPRAKRFVTFDQAADLVHKINRLTDGAPQVAYLVGWQHKGHDTGYPDVFTVNPRLGGLDGLKKAIARAAADNTVLSFHDNYDDAYTNSPAWNPDFITRSSDGTLQKAGVWGGGQSYYISPFTYSQGPARERVRRTLEMAPIRKSYHLDVLTSTPVRHDFNPASPASGAKSLEGKIAIVREFNKYGVDVTSEGLVAPFVGVIGHAWHLITGTDTLFSCEERIPFTPFVYHGHATYGNGQLSNVPDALLYGQMHSRDFSSYTAMREITGYYYLLQVPFFLFRCDEMTGYTETNGLRRVNYGPDSFIEAARDNQHYRVVKAGRPMAVDGNVFAPNWKKDAWLAYSRDGGTLDFPAPAGWTESARVESILLTPEGEEPAVPVTLANGRIRITLPPATPAKIRMR